MAKKQQKTKIVKKKILGPKPKASTPTVSLKKNVAAKRVEKPQGKVLVGKKAPKAKEKELKAAAKPVKTKPVEIKLGKEKRPEELKEKKLVAKSPIKPEKAKLGKKEVVLEVPSPKGIALLAREGKRKSKLEGSTGRKRCRETGCENEPVIQAFCRLHYIKNWKKIKRKEAIIASGQLNNYVEELVSKYPDKYLDVIRQDLATEKEWAKVVVDLELDSSDDDSGGDEEIDVVSEGVRRERAPDFDDDSDSF